MDKIELIYIVDDDEITNYLTGELIKKVDFISAVNTFTDPNLALEALKRANNDEIEFPQVILFDLNMPIMDGWAFLDELLLLNLKKEIPLFVFTSSINPADNDKAMGYPAIRGYIQKPLTITKLNKVLRLIS